MNGQSILNWLGENIMNFFIIGVIIWAILKLKSSNEWRNMKGKIKSSDIFKNEETTEININDKVVADLKKNNEKGGQKEE